MSSKLKLDYLGNVDEPTFILTTRSGKNICRIPAHNIRFSESMAGSEISFDVYKAEFATYWEQLKNLRLMFCPEYDSFYELSMDTNEAEYISKTVTGVSLGEAELSQILLHDIEINTETDISRDDYKPTVLYNSTDPSASLLNRIMGKAPHYSIAHVDSRIAGIQRTFTFDGTSLYDAFQEIGDEIGCLFVIHCTKDNSGAIVRNISVYDLMSYCSDCGKRSDSIDVCQYCGSTNLMPGYGDDTTILVTTDNLSDEITYTTDTGSVKNCFRLVAGDDLMTDVIRGCNPNGSEYLWYISDDMRADMSTGLRNKLTDYDALYNEYNNTYAYVLGSNIYPATGRLPGNGLTPAAIPLVDEYNRLINKYKTYNPDLSYVDDYLIGYSAVMKVYYDVIDFGYYLSDTLMPDASMSDTSASAQADLLTTANIGIVAVTDINTASKSTVSNAVLAMAKVIIDSRYQVVVATSSYSHTSGASIGTWTGTFTVTNYSDDTDTATSSSVTLTINADYTTSVKNKIDKALANKVETSGVTDISSLFKLSDSSMADTPFKQELKKYCLNRLNSFRDACQACLDVLVEEGTASKESWSQNTYNDIYLPYYTKLHSIDAEIALRESEINTVRGVRDENGGIVVPGAQAAIENFRDFVTSTLNFQNYIGDTYWKELSAFRREDEYTNGNYISDGLSNAEMVANALEFIDIAKNEIYKSALMQHSISASMHNLLAMPEFSAITDYFAIGNYIRVRADDQIYKLRLLSYELDYEDLSSFSVTFSDVVNNSTPATEVRKQIQSIGSISGSYDSVKRQAVQGSQSNMQLANWTQKGLDLTNMRIISNADNQDISWDSHGLLARAYYDDTKSYSKSQVKLTNTGLYYTKDNWTTASAGVGKFLYYNPMTGNTEEGYGVIADTIVGHIILGESVGIYNQGGSISLKDDGITIKNGNNTVFHADTNGNVSVVGDITATSLTLEPNVNISSSNVSGLSTVATTGNYSDLSGQPTIPTSVTQLTGGTGILYYSNVSVSTTTDSSTGITTTTTTYSDGSGHTKTNTTKTSADGKYVITDIGRGTVPSGSPIAGQSIGFLVSNEGLLKASNAIIYGTIYASAGQIGGVTIGNDSISTNYFSVDNTGHLSATGATINGTIYASAGMIGGVTITRNTIYTSYFGVSSTGYLWANGATLSGSLTTSYTNSYGDCTAKLTGGTLKFYFTPNGGTEVYHGNFGATYMYLDNTVHYGIAMHLQTDATFMAFSMINESGTTYIPTYLINYGLDPNGITARHIFYSTAYFDDGVYCKDSFIVWYGYGLKAYDGSGNLRSLVYFGYNNGYYSVFGNTYVPAYFYGTTTYLGNASYNTYIRGAAISAPKLVQCGRVAITPSAANTPTAKAITFGTEFQGVPTVVVSPETTVPGTTVKGVGATNISTTGCTIYLTRSDTTAMYVDWIAVYQP